MSADLQVIGHAVDLSKVSERDVEFSKADHRFVGDGECNASITADNDAFETGWRNVGSVIDITKTDNLHVRMTNRPARVGTMIFEEQNRGKLTAGNHLEPFFDTEADDPVKMVFGVERQFRCAVLGFDENRLVGVPEYRIFVGDEKYRPVLGDNPRKFAAIAEGAFMSDVNDGYRFGATHFTVKNEVGILYAHEAFS